MSLTGFLKEAAEKLFNHGQAASAEEFTAPVAAQLGACRTWGVDREKWPQRGQFLPNLPAHSPAMGQKDGEKWTAAVILQPTLPKSVRLLGVSELNETAGEAIEKHSVDQGLSAENLGIVDDQSTVAESSEPALTHHTVKAGDTLSKIAKEVYGNANAHTEISDANQPTLFGPDKIGPGQTLRLPAA